MVPIIEERFKSGFEVRGDGNGGRVCRAGIVMQFKVEYIDTGAEREEAFEIANCTRGKAETDEGWHRR